jgi:ribosomal protein S27E
MAYARYDLECHECELEFTVFMPEDEDKTPVFCPVCRSAVVMEPSDEDE